MDIKKFRKMDSSCAAAWLLENNPVDIPDYWKVYDFLSSKSWRKKEQMNLASYYLQKIHLNDRSEIDLLAYHIKPLLEEKAKSVKDSLLIKKFLEYLYSSV